MIRLFVALALPQTIQLQLSTLTGGVPCARWVKPENLHSTLRFIGEVENSVADDIDATLTGLSAIPLDLSLSSVGFFGKADWSRQLWAGVTLSDALIHLQAKIEVAIVRAGLPAEQRRFSPHVALARLKRTPAVRVEQFVAENAGFRAGPIKIDRFTLFSSFLSSSGAIHTPEAEYPLHG